MGAAGLRQHTKKEKQKCKNTNIQKHEKTKVQKWKKYENYKYTNTQTQGASEEITIGAVGFGRPCSSGYITATYTLLHFIKQKFSNVKL